MRSASICFPVAVLLALCACGSSGRPVSTGRPLLAADPDRESTVPTGWQWWLDRTESQLNTMRGAGARIVDIEPSITTPSTFDAVLANNVGVYERTENWWRDLDASLVEARSRGIGWRITDLEPYSLAGQRVFAITTVRNTGLAEKTWWWDYDKTAEQVTQDIIDTGMRLIDLDAYVVGGETLYAYVGILNEGVDASGWWWYDRVSAAAISDAIEANDARLIDIEVHASGAYSAIMVQDDGEHWIWDLGVTLERVTELVATSAVRLIDLERYQVGATTQYAFIGIDNANAETRRLRGLLKLAYSNPDFGDVELRGFLVKEVGGPTLAEMAAGLSFQPYSTLKLLPYLYALTEIDDNKATMSGTMVEWTEAIWDDPATDEFDEHNDETCLVSGSPGTQDDSAPLISALPTMMWESHNRTLDAVLDEYGPTNITERAHKLGMKQTFMHFGCAQATGPAQPWLDNRSTLSDLAWLFEGVDTGVFFNQEYVRANFFSKMITEKYKDTSYWSGITGRKSGPVNNGYLRGIVKREAGPTKLGIVEDFLEHLVIRSKGGSVSGSEFGYSGCAHLTVPFKVGGQVTLKTYVVTWFLTRLQSPPGCPEYLDKDGFTCQALWDAERLDMRVFAREVFAEPIRLALETW